jgi:hypothetical protein
MALGHTTAQNMWATRKGDNSRMAGQIPAFRQFLENGHFGTFSGIYNLGMIAHSSIRQAIQKCLDISLIG